MSPDGGAIWGCLQICCSAKAGIVARYRLRYGAPRGPALVLQGKHLHEDYRHRLPRREFLQLLPFLRDQAVSGVVEILNWPLSPLLQVLKREKFPTKSRFIFSAATSALPAPRYASRGQLLPGLRFAPSRLLCEPFLLGTGRNSDHGSKANQQSAERKFRTLRLFVP